MPGLRCRVLGEVEVVVDGRPSRVPPGRRRAVLACLLVHARQPVPADVLIEAAWEDALPRDPHGALHTAVSRLRAQLGAGAVEAGPRGYTLHLPPDALDAEEFAALLERARTAEPARARDLLARALALWRGPAFGEYAGAPFAAAAAGRLEGLRMEAVELHASADLACGDPGAAIAVLEPLLAEQPFREHAMELLATALYHAGRQAEALDRLREYRTMLVAELGLDPSPPLARLEAHVLGHALAPPRPSTPPTWLDTSTAFIGREAELTDVVTAVSTNRVTVITGPGGVGKSRLAAEALPAVHCRAGLPTTVVELAGVSPGRVATALADALGLRPAAESVVDDLLEYLSAVPHLLVLDNCEHLLQEVAALTSRVVRRCREVRVLATSRRRLGVEAEVVLPLAPLRVPERDATPGSQQLSAAVRLLTDRVRRVRPGFVVTADNVADVAEICRRSDGLPLALELAASRAATLGVADVLAGLPESLAGPGGLRTVVAWSYRLLTEEQQTVLACLSVFADEFTVAAVRGMTAHLPGWDGDPDAALSELVESSLVVCHLEGRTGRYRLLSLVRAFAAHRLTESPHAATAPLAHARWVRDVTEDLAAQWPHADGAQLGARLTAHRADIVVALRWALGAGHPRLAARIAGAVARCLHWVPGLTLTELVVQAAEGAVRAGDCADGVAAGAFFAAERGEYARARRLATAALRMADDGPAAAGAALALGVVAMYTGDLADSARWFRRLSEFPGLVGEGNASLALIACYTDDLPAARDHAAVALAAGPSGADASYAFARYAAGEVEARTDPARATVLLTQAAEEADRVGAEQVSRVARVALFALLVRSGRREEAVTLGRRLLADLRRWGAWPQVWTAVRVLAELTAEAGRPADAAFLLGASRAAASAPPLIGPDVERYAALEEALTHRLGPGVLEQIRVLAAGTPRAQVLSRAERLLAPEKATPAAGRGR